MNEQVTESCPEITEDILMKLDLLANSGDKKSTVDVVVRPKF